MQIYFVDTNIFLRTLIREDEQVFDDCKRFLQGIKKNKYKGVTSGIVLAEVVWTLSSFYGFKKEKVVQAVEGIQNLPGLLVRDLHDYDIALDLYGKKNVKYIDTVIASAKEVQDKKWSIVSYDTDFDLLGVLRMEPGEIVAL